LKIGFDAKRAFANYTGLGNYSRSTLQVLTQNFPEHEYYLYHGRVPNEQQIAFLELPKHADVHVKIPHTFFYQSFPSAWRRYGITSDLLRDKIELYHGLSHELPQGLERYNIRSIVTIHDLIFKRFPHYYKAADRNIYDRKFKHACDIANTIIAISEQSKRDIIDFYKIKPEKIEVVYQSCSELFSRTYSAEEKKTIKEKYKLPSDYILSVGTLEERKNTGLIVEALHKGKVDVPLVLVGRSTPYAEALKKKITEKNIKGIYFLHEVSFADLPMIYQMAKLFIYPSRFEGFGIPIIEALSSGVPVIAATGSCLEEAAGPHSLFVHPDSVEEMLAGIQSLLTSNNELLIEEGYRFVTRFSPLQIAKRLMEVYK
jgi:glycosyltransferase involved in cell wall biosynthesis